MKTHFPKAILLLSLTTWLSFNASAAAPVEAPEASAEMKSAAIHFLDSLTPEQKAKAVFNDFNDDQRKDWHFIPKARKGIPFKEMRPAQARLALALLSTGLSNKGLSKALTIMSLEEILLEIEKGKGPVRDPELYFVSIFGDVQGGAPWGWKVEGHHFAMNCTVAGPGKISVTPTFFGSNPARVLAGPRQGLRTLAEEEDGGRALVKSLDAGQKQKAIVSEKVPADILSSNLRKASPLSPVGISGSALKKDQLELLKRLVKSYLFRHQPEVAAVELAKVEKAGWGKVYFGWAGGVEAGEAHYYRVQGESFLLEYDNIQNNNNHVHSVWRDFSNDFGDDLLLKHYQNTSHK